MSLTTISLDDWQRWVESRPEATTFHHRAWIELLLEEYRVAHRVVAFMDQDGIAAAAPFLAMPRLGGGRKLISLPFSDYVTPLSRDEDSSCALLERLLEEDLSRWRSVIVRTDRPCAGVPSQANWVRHEVDLGEGFDADDLPSALRRNLRKAGRHELVFSVRTDLDAVEAFYRLHVLTRHKLGVPVQRRRFFRRLHQKIVEADLGFVGLVTKDGDAIAAGVFLTYGPTLIYKFGASEPASLSLRPNEFLFANVLELAATRGHARFDFGVSRLSNSGLRRFKLKWHSRELPVHHAYLRGAPSEEGALAARLQQIARGLIRKSPKIVCRGLGALLYRYAS